MDTQDKKDVVIFKQEDTYHICKVKDVKSLADKLRLVHRSAGASFWFIRDHLRALRKITEDLYKEDNGTISYYGEAISRLREIMVEIDRMETNLKVLNETKEIIEKSNFYITLETTKQEG